VEYVEQLTMLLFLKMADQLTEEPYSQKPIVPPELGWKALLLLDGSALENQYSDSIEKYKSPSPGMLGVIFKGARCDIHNPALLKQLIVNLIDKEDWMSLPVDVKARFTRSCSSAARQNPPRARVSISPRERLIQTMVEVMQPTPLGPHLRSGGGHWWIPVHGLQLCTAEVRQRLECRGKARASRGTRGGDGTVAQGGPLCAR
jgi:type I restriction enzyme M protein